MGDLNKYFSRSEFACKCGCGFAAVDVELLDILTAERIHYKKPVYVCPKHSGCRCESHNKAVGGSPTSFHMFAFAVDFSIEDVTPEEQYKRLREKYKCRCGIGIYDWGCHFDLGPYRRWDYRTEKMEES